MNGAEQRKWFAEALLVEFRGGLTLHIVFGAAVCYRSNKGSCRLFPQLEVK